MDELTTKIDDVKSILEHNTAALRDTPEDEQLWAQRKSLRLELFELFHQRDLLAMTNRGRGASGS